MRIWAWPSIGCWKCNGRLWVSAVEKMRFIRIIFVIEIWGSDEYCCSIDEMERISR